MPGWVVERTREWVAPLFDHYAAQTGRQLSFKPVVLLSYDVGEPGRSSYSGGGLPGQMPLQLMGGDWSTASPEREELFAHFLAHETFHMWNGEELQTHLDASE